MDPQTIAVSDHIAELRHTAESLRHERRASRYDGRPATTTRARLALGRWLVDIGTTLLGAAPERMQAGQR